MIQTMQQHLRFMRKVNITDGCWEWVGSKTTAGYGQFYPSGQSKKFVVAHRFLYAFFNGAIPAGMMLDHQCRNRGCVNPNHLRVVTPRINTIENSNSIQARNAKKTHCDKGHPFTGYNCAIYTRTNGQTYRLCRECKLVLTRKYKRATKNPTHE